MVDCAASETIAFTIAPPVAKVQQIHRAVGQPGNHSGGRAQIQAVAVKDHPPHRQPCTAGGEIGIGLDEEALLRVNHRHAKVTCRIGAAFIKSKVVDLLAAAQL